jgi:hypothetical protein
MFALCMSLIQKTGAYGHILSNWPPATTARTPEDWEGKVREAGRRWREAYVAETLPPPFVSERWNRVLTYLTLPIPQVRERTEFAQTLLELCAAADEACPGIGVPGKVFESPVDQRFFEFADRLLIPTSEGSTLCIEIHPSRTRVLPKMHTPQSGLTIRSLSKYLALCSSEEIIPKWIAAPLPALDGASALKVSNHGLCINLLIMPWPEEIYPVQFEPSEPLPKEVSNMDRERFGFFTVSHPETSDVASRVAGALESARANIGHIDGVIFPESALTQDQYVPVAAAVHKTGAFFVCGRTKAAVSGEAYGINEAVFDLPPLEAQSQNKHHRWKLEKFQIARYGLGSRLHPEMDWWEHIDLSERSLNFMPLRSWLVLSILICEDLARPDPVGDLVRAIGPNLVVALLMDGPQVKDRWSARYATTLADDPGCSVLTVTSLGMSTLSRSFDGSKPSRIVALWKDAKTASPLEIELPEGYDALVVSLAVRYIEEWAADGRSDHGGTGYPLLAGVHPIKCAKKRKQDVAEETPSPVSKLAKGGMGGSE